MKTVLDHVAVAVHDLDMAQKIWEEIGLTFDGKREIVAEQQVEVAFAQIDKNARIELLMPLENQGPIQKFLDSRGPGIHHLCFKVNDIEAKCKELVEQGMQLIYKSPVKGAHNCLVNFIHPKSTGGVLVELSMPASEE